MKTFRGIVRVKESGVILDAGGVEVWLDGEHEKLARLNGMTAAIIGEQEGDTIRKAAPAPLAETAAAGIDGTPLFAPVIAAIQASGEALSAVAGVLGVRPGFRTRDDGLVHEPAIIVVTKPGEPVGELPSEVGGIAVEARMATALELLEGLLPLSVWEGVAPEAAPQINYVPPDPSEVALKEHKVHRITCHVGPDSGWSTLKPFLEGTTTSLTVAMYEFYAQHIIDAVTRLGEESDATLSMILQVSPNDEEIKGTLHDAWGDRLDFASAAVSGPERIFNNSYHTKVAVRASTAMPPTSLGNSPTGSPGFVTTMIAGGRPLYTGRARG